MRLTCLCLISSLIAACDPTPPKPMSDEAGRAETRAIRNAEALGVSGKGVADKVDGALDANDARKNELDKAMQEQ